MPLLDLGQRQNGFASISVMNEVARLLEMPPMRVYGALPFFRVGRDEGGRGDLVWRRWWEGWVWVALVGVCMTVDMGVVALRSTRR